MTRARRHLCLVGDSDTVSHEPFIKGLIEHCHSVGEVWSAHEYLQGILTVMFLIVMLACIMVGPSIHLPFIYSCNAMMRCIMYMGY